MSKARQHLDRLTERQHDDDFDFDDEADESPALKTKPAKGVTRHGRKDWDYQAAAGPRHYDPTASVHDMVQANLPLAKTIARDFSNIQGVDPEDIMTAAKQALYSAIELYQPDRGGFSAWLSRVVRQRLSNLYQQQKEIKGNEVASLDAPLLSKEDGEEGDTLLGASDASGALDAAYGRETHDPLRAAARAESHSIIRAAVEQLDPRTQKIVWLAQTPGGLSARDIADVLAKGGEKVSHVSVLKHLNKGMERVREILASQGFVDSDSDDELIHQEPEPEPDYVDDLLAKKAARHRESSHESRQTPSRGWGVVRYEPKPSGLATAVLEAADEALDDPADGEAIVQKWQDLESEVATVVYRQLKDEEGEEGEAVAPETDDEAPEDHPIKLKVEGRRLSARDLTDRLLG